MAPRWALVADLFGQKPDRLACGLGQARRAGQGQKALDSVDTLGHDDTELAQRSGDRGPGGAA